MVTDAIIPIEMLNNFRQFCGEFIINPIHKKQKTIQFKIKFSKYT